MVLMMPKHELNDFSKNREKLAPTAKT